MSATESTRRMVRLWERMTALYGSRWQIEYGPCTNGDRLAPIAQLWAEALADVDNSAIGTALRKLLDRDALNPPTLPEFLRLCGRRSDTVATAAHRLLPPSARQDKPTASPGDRCATLAAHLDEEARPIINERLSGAIPANYHAVVSRYWLSRLAALGPLGQSAARSTQENGS